MIRQQDPQLLQNEDSLIISEEFALAHQLALGDSLFAVINGRKQKFVIAATAVSPEYIYQIAPGAMFPDAHRYGIGWLRYDELASAYDMTGGFNQVSLTLENGVSAQRVIDQLDDILKPYGGVGAIARKDQLSNRFLIEELKSLETMAQVFPLIFFIGGGVFIECGDHSIDLSRT